MKPKVHKIYHNFSYKLIGIVTTISEHQMLWILRNEFDLTFKFSHHISINKKDDSCMEFPVYACDYSSDLVYVLYSNKAQGLALVKSIKSVDYIIQCSGDTNCFSPLDFIKNIKNSSDIATAFEIDVNSLRKKEKKLFEC